MPTSPNPGTPIVPVARRLDVEAGDVGGEVIAFQFNGNENVYLVADGETQKLVWVADSELTQAYVRTGG